MMQYLLDTDTCIDLLHNEPAVLRNAQAVSPDACAVSTVTSYELLTGARKCANPEREVRKIARFLQTIHELPFSHAAAASAATIRADLERRGLPIGSYDVQIAGQAMVEALELVTSNGREFSRVNGLRLVDWRNA